MERLKIDHQILKATYEKHNEKGTTYILFHKDYNNYAWEIELGLDDLNHFFLRIKGSNNEKILAMHTFKTALTGSGIIDPQSQLRDRPIYCHLKENFERYVKFINSLKYEHYILTPFPIDELDCVVTVKEVKVDKNIVRELMNLEVKPGETAISSRLAECDNTAIFMTKKKDEDSIYENYELIMQVAKKCHLFTTTLLKEACYYQDDFEKKYNKIKRLYEEECMLNTFKCKNIYLKF